MIRDKNTDLAPGSGRARSLLLNSLTCSSFLAGRLWTAWDRDGEGPLGHLGPIPPPSPKLGMEQAPGAHCLKFLDGSVVPLAGLMQPGRPPSLCTTPGEPDGTKPEAAGLPGGRA